MVKRAQTLRYQSQQIEGRGLTVGPPTSISGRFMGATNLSVSRQADPSQNSSDPSKKLARAGPARSSEDRYPKVDRGGSRINLSPTCAARVFQLTRQLSHKSHGQTIEWLADPSKRLADARSRRLSKGHKFDGQCKRIRIPATCATRVYQLSRDLGHALPSDTIEWMLKQAEPAIIAAKSTGKIPAMFAGEDPGTSPSTSTSQAPPPLQPPPSPSPPPPATATLSGFHQAGHQQRQQTSPQFIFSSEQTKNEIPSTTSPVQQKMAIMGYHHFFKPMIGNFQKKLMIPIQFLKHFRGETLDEAFLLAPLGESWHVGLKRDVNNSLWFEDGWHEFIKAHNILLGYFLVFGYVGKMTFDVKIFDRTLCMKEYPGLAYRKDQTQRGKDGKDVEPSRKRREIEGVKERETSNFKATIKYSNLSRAYMGIPMLFMKRNLLGLEKAIFLKDPAGRSWPVKINKRHNQCAYSFGSGWAKFLHANELKKGDTCRFEVSSNKKHVLCVSISKAAKEK